MASQSSLKNDLFWSDFNASSGGIYVADVFNTELFGRYQHEKLKLTSPEYAILGTVTTAKPQITFSLFYPRILQFHRLNTPQHAIRSLRRQESHYRLYFKQTQFCWVDFDQRFSLAHTARRAQRCRERYTTNGAVYFESYMRNFDHVLFYTMWDAEYHYGIWNPLNQTAEGRAFLGAIEALWNRAVPLSVDDEVAYWTEKGITHYTMQWGNLDLIGLTERIEFVGALGVSVNFTIKTIPPTTPGRRTSDKMYWTPMNDFWAISDNATAISGRSLVRDTPNFYESFNVTMEQVMIDDGTVPWPFTPQNQLVRDALGPYGSVDMFHVLFPDSLFDLAMNTTHILNSKLLENTTAQVILADIQDRLGYPFFPKAWQTRLAQNWSFAGGNLLCGTGIGVDYIQKFVDFADSCSSASFQEPIRETRVGMIIALLSLGNPGKDAFEEICAHSMLQTDQCVDHMTHVSDFLNTYLTSEEQQLIQSMAVKAHQDLLVEIPEMMQFAVNKNNPSDWELLRLPLMTSNLTDFNNYFGWLYAIEWVTGTREVVRFEGDDGTMTLLSARAFQATLDLHGSEIPTNMSVYFLRIVQYTTIVSIICATLALLYALTSRGHVSGINLLRFNRVTGAVWVGRPLVLARGIVAVCMISTGEVYLKLHAGMTSMEESKKAWYNVLITAGESCWFSYVTVDFFVTITQGYTFRYAPLSSIVVQFFNTLIDFVMPFEHTVEINQQCEMVVFHQEISCLSGRVEIGSLSRFIMISAVAVGGTLLTFLVLRLTMPPTPVVHGGKMLLSGIAKEVFVSDGWIHQGRWYLDKSSALLTGLVTFQFGSCSRVLDVKSWTLLYLSNNRLYDLKPVDATTTKANHESEGSPKKTSLPKKLKHAIALAITIGGGSDPSVSTTQVTDPAPNGSPSMPFGCEPQLASPSQAQIPGHGTSFT